MTSSVSNKVFTNPFLSRVIFSNLSVRELDQVKAVGRVYNTYALDVQKRQLLGHFPEELAEIVKGATFQNFHRERRLTALERFYSWHEPADFYELSSPIVAGYADGVAFIACKVEFSANERIFRRLTAGIYPSPSKTPGFDILFGMHVFGGREELITLLKTGRVVSSFEMEKDRPRCCVRLCDFIRRKICKTEIERPRFEPAVLSIENFKARNMNKVKQD